MHLIKNGNKYYLSKSGNKYYGWEDDYIISNGQLKWCNPNVYLQGDKTGDNSYGNSWLELPYTTNGNTTFDIKVQWDAEGYSQYYFGAGVSYLQKSLMLYRYSGGNWAYCYYKAPYINGQEDTSVGFRAGLGTNGSSPVRFYSYIQNGTYYLKTNKQGQDIYTVSGPVIPNLGHTYTTTGVFRAIGQPTQTVYSGKMYFCSVYDNGVLVYKLVPVPANLQIGSFTVPSNGMFDIVNQQFYPNQGSGTFIYGKDT